MAKKEPTVEDSVAMFMDVIERCQFKSMLRENRVLYGKNAKKKSALLIPDQTLWNHLIENQDIAEMVRELNPKVETDRLILRWMSYANDMNNDWIAITDEEMTTDGRVYLKIKGYDYANEINKTIWPLRFRKAEVNNFSYKVFPAKPLDIFAIRKKFESPVEDASFYIMRLFQML